jgi:hypothetical protein
MLSQMQPVHVLLFYFFKEVLQNEWLLFFKEMLPEGSIGQV